MPHSKECNPTQRRGCTSSQWARAKPHHSPAGRQAPRHLPQEASCRQYMRPTAPPFHTWQGCLMPTPEGLARGVPMTGTSPCLPAASDRRKTHLLTAAERPGRSCLPPGLGVSRHLGEAWVQSAGRPQAKQKESKRSKYSESQQCKHGPQEQQRQSRPMGRLGR